MYVGQMVIFDSEAIAESDDVIAIWATANVGMLSDIRFKLSITRQFAEQRKLLFKAEQIASFIWVALEDFQNLVAQELERGRTELVL